MAQTNYYRSGYSTEKSFAESTQASLVTLNVRGPAVNFLVGTSNLYKTNITTTNFCNVVNVEWVTRFFNVQNENVLVFLSGRQDLINLLMTVYNQVAKKFSNSNLIIDFVNDPEVRGWGKLQLSIFTSLDADEAYKKFEEFNDNWWFNCLDEATKDLFIVLKFND